MSFEPNSNRLPEFDLEGLVTTELILFLVFMFASVFVGYDNLGTALWLMLVAMLLPPLAIVVGALKRLR